MSNHRIARGTEKFIQVNHARLNREMERPMLVYDNDTLYLAAEVDIHGPSRLRHPEEFDVATYRGARVWIQTKAAVTLVNYEKP